ncbi:1,4-dihydroxy-2-naphthoate octaprenyltransferase [Akkermansia muciniphila]|nr:1,4-dihydroxy-2-naphthoate octaprenyltransferase [Akkermansia muciniphila]
MATWEKRKRPPGNGTSHSLRKPSAASAPSSADYGAFPHMNIITSAFLAARPKTLTASLIPVWAGCMVVQKLTGSWNASLALLTLASCLCLQIACNFFNDAIDHAKHADTERRTGPVRMTASGALSHRTVMLIGLFFLLGACLLAFPLIELRGWPILAIGIPSLYFTYGYTGGPWPLAYKGLGEIFVILFFGLVAVLGTILVQIGTAPVVPGTLVESLAVYNAGIVTGIQCGLLCAVMISVNNIRDRKEDLTTGKRTLAVRLGEGKARAMAQSFILAAYITLPTSSRALHLNLSHTWWMWIPSILFGGYLMLLIRKTPADSRMNRVLALSSLHLLLYLATYTILPTR